MSFLPSYGMVLSLERFSAIDCVNHYLYYLKDEQIIEVEFKHLPWNLVQFYLGYETLYLLIIKYP